MKEIKSLTKTGSLGLLYVDFETKSTIHTTYTNIDFPMKPFRMLYLGSAL
jgi:hypothetical protein